ncbi:g138 [Coccomyxa elongata]
MWKTLRAAVEDGVKEFGREALSDATSTLKDVKQAEWLDTSAAREAAERAVQFVDGRLRTVSSGRLSDAGSQDQDGSTFGNAQIPMQSNPMFESEHVGGVEPRQRRYSSDWGSVSLSRGGSRAASPRRAAAEQPGRGTHLKSHSSDDIGSSWMRTADSVNSGAHSVSSDWAEYDGYAAPDVRDARKSVHQGTRRTAVHSRSNSEGSSPAKELQMEIIRLQHEQEGMEAKLKAEQARTREAEAKLAGLSSTLQQRLLQLATEVEARGSALERLRDENESLTEDYNKLRVHSTAMEDQAHATIADLERQVADACRSAAEAGVSAAAAHALAHQDSSVESRESRSAREDLEAQLEAAQTKAQAAVDAAAEAQARAVAAETARDEAISARAAAERARRETEAQAHAAAEAAEAERNERAAAEGLSEQLQADANRRAKVFHNAVKAAVAKVQAELEEERDALEARLKQVEHALAEAQQGAAASAAAAQEARREAVARTRDAEDAGGLAVAAQEAADAAAVRERAARAAAASAEAALKELQGTSGSLEAQLREASARAQAAEAAADRAREQLQAAQQKLAAAASASQAEIARWQSRAEAASVATREIEGRYRAAADASAKDAAHALQNARAAQVQVEALKRELAEVRQARGIRLYGLPSRADIFASLGLEPPGTSTASSLDLEAAAANKKERGDSSHRQLFGRDVGPAGVRGQVSLRTWIIIVYLVLLHVAVMLSFTQQHDAHAACQDHMLPGGLLLYAIRDANRRGEAKKSPSPQEDEPAAAAAGPPRRAARSNRLQAGLRRRQAAAAAAAAAQEAADESERGESSDGEEADAEEEAGGDGGRRRAREARRDARQAERQMLDARMRKREAYDEQRRRKDAEREARELAEEQEAERLAAEKQAREDEEAAKWMGQISMEQQGEDAQSEEQAQGLLQAFIDYIIDRKTVHLEDLASEFGLRVQDAISRVQTLEEESRITGVMDDRGKFIYISREEMAAVAEFVKSRGRVAIGELAAKSSTFINLEQKNAPRTTAADLDFDLGELDMPQPALVSVDA